MSRLRHIFIPILLILILVPGEAVAQEWKHYPYTPEGSLITFPDDEGWHPEEDIEWWYIAGHLEGTTSGTPYSFMLTYFYFPVDTMGFSFDGFRILNISNDQTGVFHSETMVLNFDDLDTGQLFIDARLFNFVDEYWRHREEPAGTLLPFEYELSARAGENALSLTIVSQKPPLIPGDDGLFDQGAESYTYYYSLTENRVEGMLTFEGESEEVSGTAWIDRQYGNFNPHSREKYEWFYLQLSNGMDLNIWNLFTTENLQPDHPAYKHVSVYVDSSRQYTTHDFALERLSWAKMPETENCYAQEWKLTSEQNQMDLTISTLHHNSEVEIPLNFFEGAVSATGTVNGVPVTGRGFAELLKTYEAPRLKITAPGKEWNENHPIRWELLNSDDGRPLLYDLSYSFDEGNTWLLIAGEISDTFYYWNDHPLVSGDSCLFKVFAYTADKTLSGVYEGSSHTLYDDQYTSSHQKPSPAIRIYPNPVANTLRIEGITIFLDSAGRSNYRIFDFAGRQLMQGDLSNGQVEVSQLDEGIYMIILNTLEGTSSQKFIKL